jgi:hypothetical protein
MPKDDHEGSWWSVKHNGKIMVLRVSKEFLTQNSEDRARAALSNHDVAGALRASEGRTVILTTEGWTYRQGERA